MSLFCVANLAARTHFPFARLRTLRLWSQSAQHCALLARWIGFSGRRHGSDNRRRCWCCGHIYLHYRHLARHLQYGDNFFSSDFLPLNAE